MSQAHLAYLLGTRQSNISAYEAGTLEPGPLVADRMQAFLDLAEDTQHRGTWAGTLPSHAAALRAMSSSGGAAAPADDERALRHVIGMNDAFVQLTSPEDQAFFLTSPGTTGRRKIDCLLAGLAVHWCRLTGAGRVPAWTREPHLYLSEAWWIAIDDNTPLLRAQAFAHGIPSLRARGIFVDRATLASV